MTSPFVSVLFSFPLGMKIEDTAIPPWTHPILSEVSCYFIFCLTTESLQPPSLNFSANSPLVPCRLCVGVYVWEKRETDREFTDGRRGHLESQVEDFHISLLLSSQHPSTTNFHITRWLLLLILFGESAGNSLTSCSFPSVRALRCDFFLLRISFHHVSFCFLSLYFWIILVFVSLTMEFLFLLLVLLAFMSLSREDRG